MKIKQYEVVCETVREFNAPAPLKTSSDAARFCIEELKLGEKDREHVVTISVSANGGVTGYEDTAVGGRNRAIVDPSIVFKTAILNNAFGIIVAHNHPSGDTTPSEDDIQLTHRLKHCGEILGIKLLDSIIIGGSSYYSMNEDDLI